MFTIAPILALVFTAIAVFGILHLMVSKDFFLPPFLRETTDTLRQFLAGAWVVAFTTAILGTLGALLAFFPAFVKFVSSPSTSNLIQRLRGINAPFALRIAVLILAIEAGWSVVVTIRQFQRYKRQQNAMLKTLRTCQMHRALAHSELRKKNQRIPDAVVADLRQRRTEILLTMIQFGLDSPELRHLSTKTTPASRRTKNKISEMPLKFGPLQLLASAAPMTGLLGAILAICTAVLQLSMGEPVGSAHAFKTALLITFIGMAVALPAVLAFNLLVEKFKALNSEVNFVESEIFENSSEAFGLPRLTERVTSEI